MKQLAIIVAIAFCISRYGFSQSIYCNSNGKNYDKSKYKVDTNYVEYPQIEIVDSQVYPIIDNLIEDLCINNKIKRELPFYIEIASYKDDENINIEFKISNNYSPFYDTTYTSRKIIGVLDYKGIEVYISTWKHLDFNLLHGLFKINPTFTQTARTYIVNYKYKGNWYRMLNKFNIGFVEYQWNGRKFILLKKLWVDTRKL